MTRTGKVFGSRLAVALATAIVTAVVVAGGIAIASVPGNSVGTAKIIDNSIRSVDIRNGAVKSVDIGNGQVRSVDIQNGGVTRGDLAVPLRPMWAEVHADDDGASLIRGRGAVSAERIDTGRYAVVFNRPIADCAWFATRSNDTIANTNDIGAVELHRRSSSPNDRILVLTRDADGILADAPDGFGGPGVGNRPGFMLQVIC